ncbi:MAG: hypothetical protein IKP65_00005, partial [Alphaproteobacteria bacterium]|nr:hypothetical protein [Alphaproteobacteria bacterium]
PIDNVITSDGINPVAGNVIYSALQNINIGNADSASYASSAGYVDWENVDNKPVATTSSLGLVEIGSGLNVNEFGVVNVLRQVKELIFKVPTI